MTKMEKLIVSADPETKQLIEEIQDAIADTIEAKIGEILSKKVSDIKIDSSKVKIDFSEILNNQKIILEKLSKLENVYSPKTSDKNFSSNRNLMVGKNQIDSKKRENLPSLRMLDFDKHTLISVSTSDNGVFLFNLSVVNPKKRAFYLSDESGICFGLTGSKLTKNSKSPFVVRYGNNNNLEVDINNLTYKLW